MAAAHLIHGYLGVGKTTLARRLEQSIPAIRFSDDEWITRLYGDDPPAEHFAEFYGRVHEQLGQVWPRCLELGVDVVLDFGCWTRDHRDELRAKIGMIGAEARLYRVTCSGGRILAKSRKANVGTLIGARGVTFGPQSRLIRRPKAGRY